LFSSNKNLSKPTMSQKLTRQFSRQKSRVAFDSDDEAPAAAPEDGDGSLSPNNVDLLSRDNNSMNNSPKNSMSMNNSILHPPSLNNDISIPLSKHPTLELLALETQMKQDTVDRMHSVHLRLGKFEQRLDLLVNRVDDQMRSINELSLVF
jgi:hypothetical protein